MSCAIRAKAMSSPGAVVVTAVLSPGARGSVASRRKPPLQIWCRRGAGQVLTAWCQQSMPGTSGFWLRRPARCRSAVDDQDGVTDHAVWQGSHTAVVQPYGASARRRRRPTAPQNSQTVAGCSSPDRTRRLRISESDAPESVTMCTRAAPNFSLRTSTRYRRWVCSRSSRGTSPGRRHAAGRAAALHGRVRSGDLACVPVSLRPGRAGSIAVSTRGRLRDRRGQRWWPARTVR